MSRLDLALLLACAAPAPAAAAQEPPPPPPAEAPPPEAPLVPPGQEPAEEPPSLQEVVREILELAEGIREDYRELTSVLEEAAGKAPEAAEDEEPLRQDLRRALEEADALQADLEELLDKFPDVESPPSSSPPPSGSRPRDSGRQPRHRPQNDPRDGEEGQRAENLPGTRPPGSPQEIFLVDPRWGAWGRLPPRLQEAQENAGAADLPLRYRRWLEAYHRRVLEKDR